MNNDNSNIIKCPLKWCVKPSMKAENKCAECSEKITSVKCNCPCHSNKAIIHIAPCCNNGYKI